MAESFSPRTQKILDWVIPIVLSMILISLWIWVFSYPVPPKDIGQDKAWTEENCEATGTMVVQALDEKIIGVIYDCPDNKMRIR